MTIMLVKISDRSFYLYVRVLLNSLE